MIVRVPGMAQPGSRTDALVEFVDMYPSLCEICGLAVPKHCEGCSFTPLLEDPNRPWKSAAFNLYPRRGVMGYAMRTDRYRYIEWRDRGTNEVRARELYDHQSDAQENVNVAGKDEHAKAVQELGRMLARGWKRALPP
jgi:arylsulfatase A-like enzyme